MPDDGPMKDGPLIFPIIQGTPVPPGLGPEQVGNKAYNLMRLAALDLPVPLGFVLSAELCARYFRAPKAVMAEIAGQIPAHIRMIEELSGLGFGDPRRPLLLAVRSGAAASMPGMLETVLDIGLGEDTVRGMLRLTGNPRLAWDCYRRLVETFAEIVHGAPAPPFDEAAAAARRADDADSTRNLGGMALRDLARANLRLYEKAVGAAFPQDPMTQLLAAIEAVFRSWTHKRARDYRAANGLEGLIGTAVTLQQMVFGNAGATSGAGVGFTRDPASGANRLYADFVFDGQGEDVVGGRHATTSAAELERVLPGIYEELLKLSRILEREFRDVQDFEFTVQDRRLFLLQTRRAKLSPWARVQILADLVDEGLILPEEVATRARGIDFSGLCRLRLHESHRPPLCHAVPATQGLACGHIALTAERAVAMAKTGMPVILVREDLTTDDFAGMKAAIGMLTARGARCSHAAVVARGLNKICLVGCKALSIEPDFRHCTIAGLRMEEGDSISLNGDAKDGEGRSDENGGTVYPGFVSFIRERPPAIDRVEAWCRGRDIPATEQNAKTESPPVSHY